MEQSSAEPAEPARKKPPRSRAVVVAGGILTSRMFGYLRELAQAHFFANSAYGDVLRAAFRAPNALQNLLGEGSLSASFIPVYSRFLGEGRQEEARRLAGAVFGLLATVTLVAVLAGMWLAGPLVSVLARGFVGDAAAGGVDRYDLTVRAVRILFPMTGFLVLSVWALGVLNSHRRFLLPYIAPVVWNVAIVTALLVAAFGLGAPEGSSGTERLLFAACWGALAGGLLQFLVQLPLALKLLGRLSPSLSLAVPGVREALAAFGPVVAGRGVVQLAGYLDLFLASFLAVGATAALGSAQYLFFLPVSLFGMSVAASELPELSRRGSAALGSDFAARIERGLGQSAFLTVPTALGYLVFGWLLVSALFRTGEFGVDDVWLVYSVLAVYSLGLLAATLSRLLQNSFYALGQASLPARVAVVRVTVAAVTAVALMRPLDRLAIHELVPIGPSELRLGALALAAGSALGAWIELLTLRALLQRRLEALRFPWGRLARMALLALVTGSAAGGLWWLLDRAGLPTRIVAIGVVGSFAGLYLAGAQVAGFPELAPWVGRLRRRGTKSAAR